MSPVRREAAFSRGLKVVVAYFRLNPAVPAALERDGITARYCDTSADDEAYWRLLRDLWSEGDTFVVLEQDKVPAPGAIQAIHDCPSLWCAYPVPRWQDGGYSDFPPLCCVKFHALLMERFPKLMEEKVGGVGIGDPRLAVPRHYARLDMAVALWVHLSIGRGVCWHPRGMVRHEHEEVA